MKKSAVPDRKDWGDIKVDSHLNDAYRLYAGKAIEDAIPYFVADPFQQAQALRYATPQVFGYYIFCFSEFLMKPDSAGESDVASVFVGLLVELSEKNPKLLAQSYETLRPAIDTIVNRQQFYDADQNIYGSFLEKRQIIERNLKIGS